MKKGNIILITFPFTDLSGSKLRPAVILAETTFDITVCFITTQTDRQDATDVLLIPDTTNRLKAFTSKNGENSNFRQIISQRAFGETCSQRTC